MEWSQVLAIVLPILFAIVIGIFYQNKRFEDIHKRFEDINKRFEDINKRFEDVNRRIDDVRDEVKELKNDIRELKTIVILLIQRDAGLRSREEVEKTVSSMK
ncbi:MAG: hypothetical protein ACP5TY_11705 [Thermodesulforhabdaceae bacterium]